MIRDPLTGYYDRTTEEVKFRHLHMNMLRPLLITLVIFLTVIIIVGTVVSALALYSPESAIKRPNEVVIDKDEVEMKKARSLGTCVNQPPSPPNLCILWDWDEKDFKINVEIYYYCHNTKDKRPNTKPVMRVICSEEHHWLVIFNKSYNCECDD